MSSPDFRSSTDVPTGCCAYRRELARSQTTACAAIAFGRFAYIFISLHIKHAVINTHGRFNTDDNNHMIRMYTTCPRACVRESERSETTTTVAPCITRRRGGLSRRVKNKINFEKKTSNKNDEKTLRISRRWLCTAFLYVADVRRVLIIIYAFPTVSRDGGPRPGYVSVRDVAQNPIDVLSSAHASYP